MSKKTQSTKVQPSLAFALLAIALPVLAASVLPSFAEETGTGAYQNPGVHQSGFQGASLFNPAEFLLSRRLRHAAPDITGTESSTESSESSITIVNPCDQQSSDSSSSSAASELTVYDLPESQRAVLRLQLRNHACPQVADPAYLALCRRLLKAHQLETRTGLSNPDQ